MAITDDYFAGLFDGEGCVSVRLDGKGCMNMAVSIQMCSREPVYALYMRFGGDFTDGTLKTEKGSKIYAWKVCNAKAVECLTILSEKCLNKRTACISGLRIAKLMAANNRKQPLSMEEKLVRLECLEVIQRANARGGKRTTTSQKNIDKFLSEKDFKGKKISLCDGRVFKSMTAAAKELEVTPGAVWHGVNGGYLVKGFRIYSA